MTGNEIANNYIEQLKDVLDAFPHGQFGKIVDAFLDAHNDEKQIFVMGNGGSASTAAHLSCDINKGVSFGNEKRFKVMCLNDNIPTMLAYANDLTYEDVFLEQLKNFFRVGDVVTGISASGNSENVFQAINTAKEKGIHTLLLSGKDGGKIKEVADDSLIIPHENTARIQEAHITIGHIICLLVENKLFKNN